jgi:hypothetical protein
MSGEVCSTSPHRSPPARISPVETLVDVAQKLLDQICGCKKLWRVQRDGMGYRENLSCDVCDFDAQENFAK